MPLHSPHSLLTTPSWDALFRLLAFPKFVLRPGPRGGRSRRLQTALVNLVRLRATEFPTFSPTHIWAELLKSQAPAMERRSLKRDREEAHMDLDPAELASSERLLRRLRPLIEDGAYSKACRELLSRGFHDPTDPAVKAKLQALHPSGSGFSVPPVVLSTATDKATAAFDTLIPDDRSQLLRKLVLSFPPGSSAGPSGLRPQHLREMLLDADTTISTRLLHSLDSLCRQAITGSLPQPVAEWLCGARLFPLKKKDGGIRPIAVGECLRRLVEKLLLHLPDTLSVTSALSPLQCAFGGKNACEMIGTTIQQLVSSQPSSATWGVLQLDISNAFNSVHRSAIINSLSSFAPHLLPWASASLQPSRLHLGQDIIWSKEGGQQGSPLVPLLFSLAIHQTLLDCPPTPPTTSGTWMTGPSLLRPYLTSPLSSPTYSPASKPLAAPSTSPRQPSGAL